MQAALVIPECGAKRHDVEALLAEQSSTISART
jgi:hypothetical protein